MAATAPVWPVRASSVMTRAPWRWASVGGQRIERVDQDAGKVGAGEGGENVLQHGGGQGFALGWCQEWGQALLGAGEFLDGKRGPDVGGANSARHWERPLPLPPPSRGGGV